MNIATLLFTYNRSNHTEQVIAALKGNTILPQKLFVFQDGLKREKDVLEWNKVNKLIHNIDWCDKETIVSKDNKGLAASIVSGINYAFMEYDAVIVLEDDCVPTVNFISFMQQCFEKYEMNKGVYSVSGYSWPIILPKDEFDVYACGRVSSWGWGTWKDRWHKFSIDNDILKRIKKDEGKSQHLAVWGNDLEQMMLDRIVGKNDSWAVYWALNVIENQGICINPYESLISNIGLDGTGVHCGVTRRFQTAVSGGVKSNFMLPDDLYILHTTKVAFADLYGNYTASNIKDVSKKEVLIYGLGNFFFQHEKEINSSYYITAFIDMRKEGWYAGKKVIGLEEIIKYRYDRIIIMVQNIQECIRIAKNLINSGIIAENIILGNSLYGKYSNEIDEITVLSDGRLLLKFSKISIKVGSLDEFNNVCEVFLGQTYSYFVNNGKRDIVLDIGMNIGDASLFFANQTDVEKVYGYEPFNETFISAEENLVSYIESGKVDIFRYGISSENAIRSIVFNSDMSCGQSTLGDVREKAYKTYLNWGLLQETNNYVEQIEVKKASEVFEPIIHKYSDYNIILKIDCEGEEYGIIEELMQSGVLGKIKFIMLEWHYKGNNIILKYLKEAGFSWWCNDKNQEMGLIYAYNENI